MPSCLSERDGHRGSWILLQPLRAVDAKCRMMSCRWKKVGFYLASWRLGHRAHLISVW